MAKVLNRAILLLKKREKLDQIHGVVKGGELFKEQYGQEGVDEVFNYMVSCATPENYRKAEELGMPPGSYIIPMEE